jgi:hypothetical protein
MFAPLRAASEVFQASSSLMGISVAWIEVVPAFVDLDSWQRRMNQGELRDTQRS